MRFCQVVLRKIVISYNAFCIKMQNVRRKLCVFLFFCLAKYKNVTKTSSIFLPTLL